MGSHDASRAIKKSVPARFRPLPLLLQLLIAAASSSTGLSAALPALISGDGHYLALTDQGDLYGWGRNDFGQLGSGARPAGAWGGPTTPTRVLRPKGFAFKSIGAGDNHSLAIAEDGSLWGWGRNDLGQLGFRTSLARRWFKGGPVETSPVKISSDQDWAAVTGGMLSTFALKRDGSLWVCGGNWAGQLGGGASWVLTEFDHPLENLPQLARLTRIGKDSDWSAISAGPDHVLAQKRDGSLWAWGRNHCGQLGNGSTTTTNRPTPIGRDTTWKQFSAGGAGMSGSHSAGIKRDGTLWVWGNWKRIRLPKGVPMPGDTNLSAVPAQLGTDTDWAKVACGNEFSAALKTDGTLWVWGANASGRAPSIKPPGPDALPAQVNSDKDWTAVAVDGSGLGGEATLHAVKANGTVWTWDPQVRPGPLPGNLGTSGGITGATLVLSIGTTQTK